MKVVLFSITSNIILAIIFFVAMMRAKKHKKHWGIFWAAVGIEVLSATGMLLPLTMDSKALESFGIKATATAPELAASVIVFVIMAVFVARYLKKRDAEIE